jgi:cytochrome b
MAPDQRRPAEDIPRIRVWDPLVRLTHWIIALGCLLNLWLVGGGNEMHDYVGYAVLGSVLLRVVWGFVGTPHARFTDFVPKWSVLRGYAGLLLKRGEPRYLGHNPAGAIMMVALLALAFLCGLSGWMMGLDRFWGNSTVHTLHEVTAYLILAGAFLHVVGAIAESIRHRENLVLSMITGRKRACRGSDVEHAPRDKRASASRVAD